MITSSYRHIAAIENASMAQLFVATAKAIVIFSDRSNMVFRLWILPSLFLFVYIPVQEINAYK
jgi:hypothetical protein